MTRGLIDNNRHKPVFASEAKQSRAAPDLVDRFAPHAMTGGDALMRLDIWESP